MNVTDAVIGWREWVALPEWGITRIKAKVDTGARSSAMHAYALERYEEDGRTMVSFEVHPKQRSALGTVRVLAPMIDERTVRNPGGRSEIRPVVRTQLGWRDALWHIELTLTRRDEMGFRLLLGRHSMRGRALVDPGRSYLGNRSS